MTAERDGQEDNLIHDAAARLDIPEVALFRLAHRWWWGRDPREDELDRLFSAYMFRQAAPTWVHHYAREVCRSNEWGQSRREKLCLDTFEIQRVPPRRGRLVVSLTAALYALVFVMLLGTAYDPRTSAPIGGSERPLSCQGGGPGLVLLEDFAYAFTGRPRPVC